MDQAENDYAPKKNRKPKTELESKVFKDGAIYLFKRADYKKPTWFCRVKVPGAKGYVSLSTRTTNEHDAYGAPKYLTVPSLLRVLFNFIYIIVMLEIVIL